MSYLDHMSVIRTIAQQMTAAAVILFQDIPFYISYNGSNYNFPFILSSGTKNVQSTLTFFAIEFEKPDKS